jgi:hypothetical protein
MAIRHPPLGRNWFYRARVIILDVSDPGAHRPAYHLLRWKSRQLGLERGCIRRLLPKPTQLGFGFQDHRHAVVKLRAQLVLYGHHDREAASAALVGALLNPATLDAGCGRQVHEAATRSLGIRLVTADAVISPSRRLISDGCAVFGIASVRMKLPRLYASAWSWRRTTLAAKARHDSRVPLDRALASLMHRGGQPIERDQGSQTCRWSKRDSNCWSLLNLFEDRAPPASFTEGDANCHHHSSATAASSRCLESVHRN